MQYAATINLMGKEEVAVVLPLKQVPAFDPDNAPPNAYLVRKEVQRGWIKQNDGSFAAPPEVDTPDADTPELDTPESDLPLTTNE